MKNTSSSVQEAIALLRMSLVQAVFELIQCHWPLSAALEQVASAQPLAGEGESGPQLIAKRTLEDWYYAFKQRGFEGLKPKARSDRGKPRRLSAPRTCHSEGAERPKSLLLSGVETLRFAQGDT